MTSLNTLENLTAAIPAALVAGVASDLASSAARCAGRVRSRSHTRRRSGTTGMGAGERRGTSWQREALPGGSCGGPGWPWWWGEAGVGELSIAGVVAQANALRWLP